MQQRYEKINRPARVIDYIYTFSEENINIINKLEWRFLFNRRQKKRVLAANKYSNAFYDLGYRVLLRRFKPWMKMKCISFYGNKKPKIKKHPYVIYSGDKDNSFIYIDEFEEVISFLVLQNNMLYLNPYYTWLRENPILYLYIIYRYRYIIDLRFFIKLAKETYGIEENDYENFNSLYDLANYL